MIYLAFCSSDSGGIHHGLAGVDQAGPEAAVLTVVAEIDAGLLEELDCAVGCQSGVGREDQGEGTADVRSTKRCS